MTMRVSALASVLVMGLLSSTARAGVIAYSNFGPGDSYDVNNAWPVQYQYGDYGSIAASFDSGVTDNVDRYTVAVTGNKAFTLQLYQDQDGLPGTVLETLTTPVPASTTVPALMEVLSVGHPHLVAGNRYWVALLPASNSAGSWMYNNQSAYVIANQIALNGTWNGWYEPQGALRVEVPEPATVGVFAVSILCILNQRWRKA